MPLSASFSSRSVFVAALRPLALYALLLSAGLHQAVAEQPAPGLSFSQARQTLMERSDQLAASAKAVESARLRRQGNEGLGGPQVMLSGRGYHYSMNADISLDPARNALDGMGGMLPPPLGQAVPSLPYFPDNYDLQHKKTTGSASMLMLWPVYMGGFSNAVRQGLDAATDEAQSEADGSNYSLQTQLVQRYFGAQLAERAARLREDAVQGIREHDTAAQSMLKAGVISQLERLQAAAALADARQQASKARDDAHLAATALARSLKEHQPLRPSTPLFVNSKPLPPLQDFITAAEAGHPALGKVAAKQRQAESMHDAQEALRKPQLLAFGSRDLNTSGKANWVAGLTVRWTLWSSTDRDTLAAASQSKIDQVRLLDAQARTDIGLLVEKNWLAVSQAQSQYQAQQAQEDLARELLRLRKAALKEGTGTTLELIDAQLNLAKVLTQRAEQANQYVQALAALLESSGRSQEFENYMAQADIQISSSVP